MFVVISLMILLVEIPHCFSEPSARRNVLILLGDDVGLDLKAYNNSIIKMPNVDGLAKRGVTFQHGFTAVSSCSPSRYVFYFSLFLFEIISALGTPYIDIDML